MFELVLLPTNVSVGERIYCLQLNLTMDINP